MDKKSTIQILRDNIDLLLRFTKEDGNFDEDGYSKFLAEEKVSYKLIVEKLKQEYQELKTIENRHENLDFDFFEKISAVELKLSNYNPSSVRYTYKEPMDIQNMKNFHRTFLQKTEDKIVFFQVAKEQLQSNNTNEITDLVNDFIKLASILEKMPIENIEKRVMAKAEELKKAAKEFKNIKNDIGKRTNYNQIEDAWDRAAARGYFLPGSDLAD